MYYNRLRNGGESLDQYGKIGIFDSGLGGLSVLKSIKAYMPYESLIYIGDSLNAPYGSKTKEEVYQLSKAICDRFIEADVKAIVIACNTATSAAADRLRELYTVPIIGMEPAIKPALNKVEGRIYVFATEMTLKEEKFNALVDKFDLEHRIIKCPAPEWVQVVEESFENVDLVREAIRDKLSQYDISINDGIVLGCTHFIFLRKYIEDFLGGQIEIFDGNMGTALQLKNILSHNNSLMGETRQPATLEIINTKSEELVVLSKKLVEG